MVSWHGDLPVHPTQLVVLAVVLVVLAVAISLSRWGRRWLEEHRLVDRSVSTSNTSTTRGVLAAAGSLPPEKASGYADAGETTPAVLRIDEAEPPARCPACDRSIALDDAFCWRCGRMVADEGTWPSPRNSR